MCRKRLEELENRQEKASHGGNEGEKTREEYGQRGWQYGTFTKEKDNVRRRK
jgi:hypothetical protein